MKKEVSQNEFRKYYLSEFELYDGEAFITFNIVILYNDKIEIYYNYTLRKDPDDRCQGLLFYSGESSIRVCVSYTKVIQQPMIVELYI